MRVLLLGTTGKVGAPVLRELLDRGHHVTAVVDEVENPKHPCRRFTVGY